MSVVTVVAKVVARNECLEAVKAELLKLVPLTKLEQGCIEYRLHQDTDHPATFVFFENWESEACLEAHLETAHFKAYLDAVAGKIEERTLHKLTSLSA